jgi:hypothetical protein
VDPVDQPDRLGLGGIEQASREHELAGAAGTDGGDQ